MIPGGLGEFWGPSEAELTAAAALEFTSQVDFTNYETDLDECSSSEADEDCWEDEELYEQMATLALRDEYATRHSADDEMYSSDSSVEVSPLKKRRRHN